MRPTKGRYYFVTHSDHHALCRGRSGLTKDPYFEFELHNGRRIFVHQRDIRPTKPSTQESQSCANTAAESSASPS